MGYAIFFERLLIQNDQCEKKRVFRQFDVWTLGDVAD